MRLGIFVTVLLGSALAWAGAAGAAAVQQTFVLCDTAMVPVRAVVPWLGAAVKLTGDGLQLTQRDTTLAVTDDRTTATINGKPCTLPAPAFQLDGITYLPVRTLADCFQFDFARDVRAATLTLTCAGHPALVFQTRPFPRPACVKEETLAGLTIGDRLAYAVACWGNPTETTDNGDIPRATDYTFRVDKAGALSLTVSVRDHLIVCISSSLTGKVAAKSIDKAALRKSGTGQHLTLAGDPRRVYGTTDDIASDMGGDYVFVQYRRGTLRLVCSFMVEPQEFQEILLMKSTTPLSILKAIDPQQ